jgi:hypothetical protein
MNMQRKLTAWLPVSLTSLGMSLIVLGVLAIPRVSYADLGPTCNEGGDPSMPLGCYGTCDSPKICEAHPIKLVCKCR